MRAAGTLSRNQDAKTATLRLSPLVLPIETSTYRFTGVCITCAILVHYGNTVGLSAAKKIYVFPVYLVYYMLGAKVDPKYSGVTRLSNCTRGFSEPFSWSFVVWLHLRGAMVGTTLLLYCSNT